MGYGESDRASTLPSSFVRSLMRDLYLVCHVLLELFAHVLRHGVLFRAAWRRRRAQSERGDHLLFERGFGSLQLLLGRTQSES